MICEGCSKPAGGIYIVGCRECSTRLLARSWSFYESQRDGRLTPAYRRGLRALGKDVLAEHERVKAKAVRTGVAP